MILEDGTVQVMDTASLGPRRFEGLTVTGVFLEHLLVELRDFVNRR